MVYFAGFMLATRTTHADSVPVDLAGIAAISSAGNRDLFGTVSGGGDFQLTGQNYPPRLKGESRTTKS